MLTDVLPTPTDLDLIDAPELRTVKVRFHAAEFWSNDGPVSAFAVEVSHPFAKTVKVRDGISVSSQTTPMKLALELRRLADRIEAVRLER